MFKSSLISFVLIVLLSNIECGTIKLTTEHGDGYHPDILRTKATLPHRREELQSKFWLNNGQNFLTDRLHRSFDKIIAKNVIMFLGDGMSIPTITAARMYSGGEEIQLAFEQFQHIGKVKTYCVDFQVPDSACTATAYLNGVKANFGTIGVNGLVPRKDCTAELDSSTHTYSIAKWAMDAGKDAGLVTTARVTHASPAGVYAHTAERYWENDNEVEKSGCSAVVLDDIAKQLVHGDVGSRLKVILGGGRREFLDSKIVDEEGTKGKRKDGRNLIEEWLQPKSLDQQKVYVWNNTALKNVDTNTTDYLLGLFAASHCPYNMEVEAANAKDLEPSLAEMVNVAIDILSKNDNGFFLFVEGGRIDMAHHDTFSHLALDETLEFSKAIELARSKLSVDDTLIVVTADHSHTLSISGYPDRARNILNVADNSDTDKLPYLTLNYANGNGYHVHVNETGKGRLDPTQYNLDDMYFEYPATLPLDQETHGGDDVAVYASGPSACLFGGVYEQNVLPHIMGYAACIGNGIHACD